MPSRTRISQPIKIGYATAELGINTVETLLRIYLLIYYTNVVGLEAGLGGVAMFLALAWDAVTDPLMGMISDRTRDRFGGRRGYLPVGGLLLATGTMALFWPPDMASQAGRFAWFLGSYCFLNTGMTVLSVPYMAMAGEMSSDPHERTALFGWRFVFANLGAMGAAILPLLFLGSIETGAGGNAATMPQVSVVASAMALLSALISWQATRRARFIRRPVPAESILRTFSLPMRSPTFRPLLAAYVVATTGIGINATTFLYYYKYHLRLPELQTQQVLAVFLLVFTLSILLWVKVARHFGKIRPLVISATVLGFGNTALYLLLPTGSAAYWWVMILGAVGLASFVGSIVLFDTLLTDVLDHDQVHSGEIRSGLFFGVWRFASKLARGGSVLIVGLVLWAVDFQEQQEIQPDGVESALVWLFGPGVGAFFLASAGILRCYRFDKCKQEQVRRILTNRADRPSRATPRQRHPGP